jgi:hypothetical protein
MVSVRLGSLCVQRRRPTAAANAYAEQRQRTHLEVPVHDPLAVHVVDRLEYLLDQVGRVALRVAALLDDPVEKFAAIDAGTRPSRLSDRRRR